MSRLDVVSFGASTKRTSLRDDGECFMTQLQGSNKALVCGDRQDPPQVTIKGAEIVRRDLKAPEALLEMLSILDDAQPRRGSRS